MKGELELHRDIFLDEECHCIGLDVLCAYLQYGLEVENTYAKARIGVVSEISIRGYLKTNFGSTVLLKYIGSRYKLCLIPIEELPVWKTKELGYKDTKSLRLAIAKGTLNYHEFDNLASEHYDLFGLFEDGLAIRK